jgi:hypothetical protein
VQTNGKEFMRYKDFEDAFSAARLNKYKNACGGNFKELQQIKAFRNRIAHHEPICFDAAGRKSMVYAQTNYALILKYIAFLGYDKNHLLMGLDVMPDSVMNKIIQL